MGPVGVQEMVVIFLVALLLFGPKKLPELGKTIAKAVSEFRRAQSDLKATFEREMRSLEQENEALKEATRQAAVDLANYSEIDLGSVANGNYGADAHPAIAATDLHGVESGAPTTVSASEIPGAELHGSLATSAGESSPPAIHAAEGTVARGTSSDETAAQSGTAAPSATAGVAVAEAPADPSLLEDPLHENRNN